MRTLEIKRSIFITWFDNLLPDYQELLLAARRVKPNAQAPYSGFKVGAAVLDVAGYVSTGVNVERCTYTQTTHAEQNAIDNMVSKYGPMAISAIAIDAVNDDRRLLVDEVVLNDLIFPCGHCLQIIWENCLTDTTRGVTIISYLDSKNLVALAPISSLLPVRFGPNNLGLDVFSKLREDR